jgi:hypothetical protein
MQIEVATADNGIALMERLLAPGPGCIRAVVAPPRILRMIRRVTDRGG